MNAAIDNCRKLILLLSNNSLESKFVTSEWAAFFARNPPAIGPTVDSFEIFLICASQVDFLGKLYIPI